MDAMDTLEQKRLLRVDEAAQILNVSRWTVYRWVEAGRLGGTRLSAGSLRIFSHTVAALIDLHCVGNASAPVGGGVTDVAQVGLRLIRRQETVSRVRPRKRAAV
jgi:excisionase family DNA binding protein